MSLSVLKVLYVEDVPGLRADMIEFWRRRDRQLEFIEAGTLQEAMAVFGSRHVDRLVVDLCLGGLNNVDGLKFIEWVRQRDQSIPIIVLTGALTLERQLRLEEELDARAFVKAGADRAWLHLATLIRSGAGRRSNKPDRPPLVKAVSHDELVDAIDAFGGKFAQHHQTLEAIKVTRTYRREHSITHGAEHIGLPRTTYAEKLNKLGLRLRRSKDDG